MGDDQKKRARLVCHLCGGELKPPPDGSSTASYRGPHWFCTRCGAAIHVERGDYSLHGEISGTNAADVAEVVRTLLNEVPSSEPRIDIANSTIGILNTGEIEDIKSIGVSVGGLSSCGNEVLAEALKALTEAAASERELSAQQRQEFLEQLEYLGRQANTSKEDRVQPSVIRSILGSLATAAGAAGGLAEVWSTWGPTIVGFF